MTLSEKQFNLLFPLARTDLLAALNRAMAKFKIDSPVRVAAFLAQVGHESAGLTTMVENLNYGATGLAQTWPKRFRGSNGKPNPLAINIQRKPEMIANHVYANRLGNGPVESGDGWRYRGRGLIQTTGKVNYAKLGAALGVDIVAAPEAVELPELACMSAAYFWDSHGLNTRADAGKFADITLVINGGNHGQVDRLARWKRIKQVLIEV